MNNALNKNTEILEHGLMRTYKKGCRCPMCKAANNAYQHDYQKRKKAARVAEMKANIPGNGVLVSR